MVWLISFMTVSNIAMGYGLAVYVNRHFGTPEIRPPRLTLARLSVSGTALMSITGKGPTEIAPRLEASDGNDSATGPAEDNLEDTPDPTPLGTVDEEKVLAGIEEFRSQLAKINVAAAEKTNGELEQSSPELAVAT